MKKVNLMMAAVLCFYGAALAAAWIMSGRWEIEKNREYLVEVNRMMYKMEQEGTFLSDLQGMEQICSVSFLPLADMNDTEKLRVFFRGHGGLETHVEPLVAERTCMGLVRFDYKIQMKKQALFLPLAVLIMLSGIVTLAVLFYVKNRLVKPFSVLSNMPYELSKGRMETEIEESRNRFFGKFVWGIAMLRDNLKAERMKALRLEKEKKMLLLSISHDVKTPLNAIKLYARALCEGVYDTEEKRSGAAEQIEGSAKEIESYVKKIVAASSEEIVHVEVDNSEFYLKELADMIKDYYDPKCRLVMTTLIIGKYDNKLLRGSRDSAFEAVENIMENAFKYGDGRAIEISFYEEEYCQLIRIKNTGEPVKQEEMPHLFDSFYRGSNTEGKDGNGLGLYICREIMRKMDGEIFAQREEDGMSFHLVFRC